MPYFDRNNTRIHRWFDDLMRKLHHPSKVSEDAKGIQIELAKKFRRIGKVMRAKPRIAMNGACYLVSCQLNHLGTSYKEIADLVKVNGSYITEAINKFYEYMPQYHSLVDASDSMNSVDQIIYEFLEKLGISPFIPGGEKIPSYHSQVCSCFVKTLKHLSKNNNSTPATLAITSVLWMVNKFDIVLDIHQIWCTLKNVWILHDFPQKEWLAFSSLARKKQLIQIMHMVSARSPSTISRAYNDIIKSPINDTINQVMNKITNDQLSLTSTCTNEPMFVTP